MRVHNISDRPNTSAQPRAIRIGRQKIRPGKFADVDPSFFNQKVWDLHGKVIWIGDHLPAGLRRTSKAGLKSRNKDLSGVTNPQMTIKEARAYLDDLSVSELMAMCDSVVPALAFPHIPSKVVLVSRLGRTLFMPDRVLDPEVFFWLRRWVKQGDNYVERE